MADRTITSADSVFTISVPGLFPAPIKLQGYSADRAFTTDAVDLAEVLIGVDGLSSAGYTPNLVRQTITLQADSDSIDLFDSIARASKAARTVFFISGTIDLPSTGRSYICTRGVLTNWKPLADAAKVLQPVDFQIVWQSIDPTLS